MNGIQRVTVFLLAVTAGLHAGSAGPVDSVDAAVVRTILDKIGWTGLPVDSVLNIPAGEKSNAFITGTVRITELNLERRDDFPAITALPPEISRLPELQSLSLKGNVLDELPSTFATLYKLVRIDLSANRFASIPGVLEGLPLQVLYCNNNEITAVPQWIGTFERLQSFSLAANKIDSVPQALAQLQNLATLVLDSNLLDGIPEELTGLSGLRVSVTANRLCSADSAIAAWLDRHSISNDWRSSQRCNVEFRSVITESKSGTILQFDNAVNDSAVCLPVTVEAMELPSFGWFTRGEVLKAVRVRFNDCYQVDGDYFLVTFSVNDLESAVTADHALSIYFARDSLAEYIGGTTDSATNTVSIRANREGEYLLAARSTAVAAPVSAATVKPVEKWTIRQSGSRFSCTFHLSAASPVTVSLFTPSGRRVHTETFRCIAGQNTALIHPVHRLSRGSYLARLEAAAFSAARLFTLQ